MRIWTKSLSVACAALMFGSACGSDTAEENGLVVEDADFVKEIDSKGDASAVAVFVNFEFDGELITSSSWRPESQIEDQMLYTIGHLNGSNSVGRLDKLKLSNVVSERLGDGTYKVKYRAILPVAWGNKTNIPQTYKLTLPVNMTQTALDAFATKYGRTCVDWGAHDVDSGSMWYYYRPNRSGCRFDDGATLTTTASVSLSDINTSGKYPEYDKVWEDDALKVVAVFGKYEDGATTASDAGVAAYNRFISTMKSELRVAGEIATTPAVVPNAPGVENPDVTFTVTMADGKQITVVALLVDNVRTAPTSFNERYENLSGDADLIVYNGHAGLGANVRALAQKGTWVAGQYSIVFMNGCDTYAYVDSAMWDARAAVNPDDPTGTKHLDLVTNAMPSFFNEMSNGTTQLLRALMDYDSPKTYEQIFEKIDESEVVLVSGEHDNAFVPGGQPGDNGEVNWTGLTAGGPVARDEEKRFETPVLAPGTYTFAMTGDNDADLYVRVGNEPTLTEYDCRPYKYGSDETCVVELSAPTTIQVMVHGWEASTFELSGKRD